MIPEGDDTVVRPEGRTQHGTHDLEAGVVGQAVEGARALVPRIEAEVQKKDRYQQQDDALGSHVNLCRPL